MDQSGHQFGTYLNANIPNAYRSFYVDYDGIRKQFLQLKQKQRHSETTGTVTTGASTEKPQNPAGGGAGVTSGFVSGGAEAVIRDIFYEETKKVNNFCDERESALKVEYQVAAKQLKYLRDLISSGNEVISPNDLNQFLDELEKNIEIISAELVHLVWYIRVEFKTLARLCVFYDYIFERNTSHWFLSRLAKEPFSSTDVDKLFIRQSLLWEQYRETKEFVLNNAGKKVNGQNLQGEAWVPPESFIRNTTKYWVKPEMVARCTADILKHVPYLVFGYSSSELSTLLNPLDLTNKQQQHHHIQRMATTTTATGLTNRAAIITQTEDKARPEISAGQTVSSIYFDSEDGYSYRQRFRRLEGAQLVRFRWYGDNNRDQAKQIFIERKTHHEGWSGESSAKERFVLPQKRVFDFMKGTLNIDEWSQYIAKKQNLEMNHKKVKNILSLGKEINTAIQTHRLQPMVRTSYLRNAFQSSSNNQVRFSLDTNLCMVDEFIPNFHSHPPWCRLNEEILSKDQVVRFPFAVLEVKLQTEQPTWVTQMLTDCGAIMVYKFSKFQHGMAFLHKPLVEKIGIPHWVPEFEAKGYVNGFDLLQTSMGQSQNGTDTVISDSAGGPVPNLGAGLRTGIGQTLSINQSQGPNDNLLTGAIAYSSSSVSPINRNLLPGSSRFALLSGSNNNNNCRPNSILLTGSSLEGRRILKNEITQEALIRKVYENKALERIAVCSIRRRQRVALTERGGSLLLRNSPKSHVLGKIRSKNIRKIDPKSIFAAERTLLHYVQKVLYLLILAIVLIFMNAPGSLFVGLTIGVSGLCALVTAYRMHRDRTETILRRVTKQTEKERFDDQWGPIWVTGFLGLVISIVLGIDFFSNYQLTISKPTMEGGGGYHHQLYK